MEKIGEYNWYLSRIPGIYLNRFMGLCPVAIGIAGENYRTGSAARIPFVKIM
jgi:hypothetical protein